VNLVYDGKRDNVTLQTAEQNLIVRIGKSEAEVTTDSHEASRGLSATAELFSCDKYSAFGITARKL